MPLPSKLLALCGAGFVCLLASCGPSAESVAAAESVMTPVGKGATITVYRSLTPPAATSARIYANDAFLGYVSSRSQNSFSVKPGNYVVTVRYPNVLLLPMKSKPFTVTKGEAAHFGVGFSGGGEFVSASRLARLDPQAAAEANRRYPSREE